MLDPDWRTVLLKTRSEEDDTCVISNHEIFNLDTTMDGIPDSALFFDRSTDVTSLAALAL